MPYDENESILARMYDGDYASARTPSGDVAFYVEEARRSGGPVAEFGCGTGRVLVPTAEAGVRIVGVDSSEAMLAQARRKLEGLDVAASLRRGDLRDVDLGERFALVTVPFRAVQHLDSTADHLRAFRNLGRHLAPGGRLVFDVFHPNPRFLIQEWPESLQIEREEGGRKIRRYHKGEPRRSVQHSRITMRWEIEDAAGVIENHSSTFVMRWFHRYEVEHLLARCGLEVEALYGDFDRSALADDSPEMIFVARAAG